MYGNVRQRYKYKLLNIKEKDGKRNEEILSTFASRSFLWAVMQKPPSYHSFQLGRVGHDTMGGKTPGEGLKL